MGYQNFFATKLYTDVGAADVVITLETPPTATSGRLVIEARNATQREIVKYTGVSGNQITGVTRGQGGTTAKTHLKNALVEMNATSEDLQDLYDAFNSFSGLNGTGWNVMSAQPNTVTYNGNRSYNLVWNGSNQTNLLSPGGRLKTTRAVAAPTQSTSLNGTTQYWSKTTPNKMTFTDDFVVSAWVKLSSYAAGTIASRYNGTSGWVMDINSSGQVRLIGFNAGGANNSLVISYQSLPFNKWVHVTAQLDMSAFTATTTTSYVMFDGVDTPASVTRAGTNPTALVQAGDLQIGAANGATFFPGKIAQVAIFNAKVTQATMRGYISQGLAGTETSLASAYSFNGVATDLNTTTPNDLTANGSAVATNADSPFGTQASGLISSTLDYGIVQSATFSTDTTVVVQVPEGCTIPTSGGVSAISYSNMKAPYGFPSDEGRWTVELALLTGDFGRSAGGTVAGTWYGDATRYILAPIGKWKGSWKGGMYTTNPTGTLTVALFSLSTSLTAETSKRLTQGMYSTSNVSSMALTVPGFAEDKNLSFSTATPLYPIVSSPSSTDASKVILFNCNVIPMFVTLSNAYL